MIDIGEEFVLLQQECGIGESQLVTRVLEGISSQWEARLGLDAGGNKHLLFQIGDEVVPQDSRSRGVELRTWELVHGPARPGRPSVPRPSRFLDLRCRDAALGLAFDRMVEDVLHRLQKPGATALMACQETLDDWRALLQAAGALDLETVIGLTGELEVLHRLASADPRRALPTWRGPEAAVHDFAVRGRALEVKTTAGVDAGLVSISNLDQLDGTSLESLHLVVVHVREDGAAPSLDDRVRALIEIGVPRDELIRAVANAGYVFETADPSAPKFRVRGVRIWNVTDSFPGLTRPSMGEQLLRGVSRVKYDLSLDAAPRRIPDPEAEKFLRDWTRP